MSKQDISYILSSRERLDLTESDQAALDDTGPGPGDDRHSIQGPDGKYYQPLQLQPSTNQDSQEEHSQDDYEQGVCGLWICKPKWSQRLANLNVFVVMYGIAGIWMMTLSSFLGSQVTSIERHLGISSSKTGFILSSNEIGYLVAVILGCHLGKYAHIPVLLSVSGIVFGLATVTMAFGSLETPQSWLDAAVPSQLATASDSDDHTTKYLCTLGLANSNDPASETGNSSTLPPSTQPPIDGQTSNSTSWVFWLLVFCAMIGGAVKSYRFPLLTYYIESNIVNKDRTALLLGISITAMILGPPIALFLGGYISSLPMDLKETTMSQNDQRWVGAWWLGFVIIGLSCVACSVPIMFFPRHIRRKKGQESTNKTCLRTMLLDLPKSLERCFRRPIFVLALIYNCIEGFAFSGSFAFFQKYMETQFNKTPQEISTVTGALCLFSIVLGTFSGGFITSKLKLGIRGCAALTLALAIITFLFDCLYLIFGCENSEIVGITGNRTLLTDNCDCSQEVFIVCGDNQVNYLSPCLAGCRNATPEMIFNNCTSIDNGQARPGMCDLDCRFFIPFLVNYFVGYFLGTLSIMPGFMLSVRSVELRDQSLASGTAAFCQTLLGILPSPIFYGKIIDMSCFLWSTGGSCHVYDRERFRLLFHGANLGLRSASFIVMALLLWLAHRQVKQEAKQASKPQAESS